MKKIKMFFRTALLLLFLFSLTGCGSGATVNTTLSINKDFSGVRTMQMVFAKSTFEDYFEGSIDDLNNTLNANIPENVTYDYSEVDDNYYYQFYIQFSSIEDYNAKVNSIVGEEKTVVVSCPEDVWISGIYVEEDFTSTDLLKWLSDALVGSGQLSSSYVSNLFGSGATKVVFQGNEIDTDTQIYVDQMEHQRINSIDIYTDINDLETITRTIEFNIPAESMNNKGEEIDNAMNSVKPSNASIEKEEVDGNTIYTYSAENLTVDDVDGFMKTIFGQDNATTSTENVDDYYSPFSFNRYIQDNFNLQNYVLGNVSTNVRYYVKSNSQEYEFRLENSFDGYYDEESEGAMDDYKLLLDYSYYGSDENSINIPLLIQKNYKVRSVDVNLAKGIFSKWTRTIKFTLDLIPSEEEISSIKDKIESKYMAEESLLEATLEEITDAPEREESNVEVDSTEAAEVADIKKERNVSSVTTKSGDEFTVTIKQKGTLEKIQKEAAQIFGQAASTNYMSENGLFKIKKMSSIEEQLYLGNFVDNRTEDYVLNYTAKIGVLSKVIKCNLSEDEYTVENGKIKIVEDGNAVRLDVVYSAVDGWIVGFIYFILVFVVLISISIKASGIIKIEKKVSTKNEEIVITGEVCYCTKCGKPNPISGMFCENCGEKLEE